MPLVTPQGGRASEKPAANVFSPPVRQSRNAEPLLLVFTEGNRDPLLDDYREIMQAHGHPTEEFALPLADAATVRAAIRSHPRVQAGEIRGIVLLGKTIPSFVVRYFYPNSQLVSRGHSDAAFGSDFPFFDTAYETLAPDGREGWDVRRFTAQLDQGEEGYVQNQWVARVFSLDRRYLETWRARFRRSATTCSS